MLFRSEGKGGEREGNGRIGGSTARRVFEWWKRECTYCPDTMVYLWHSVLESGLYVCMILHVQHIYYYLILDTGSSLDIPSLISPYSIIT